MKFIGFYDYTVILTYMSLVSAVLGMVFAHKGAFGAAMLCLFLSGFCDAFDGTVARTKKNRTEEEKAFGIQIASLSDIVAFGVLPAVIAITVTGGAWYICVAAVFYVLAGLIRPIMTEAALANLSLIGNVLIFCVGVNLVWGKTLKVANMLPAVVIAVVWAFFG